MYKMCTLYRIATYYMNDILVIFTNQLYNVVNPGTVLSTGSWCLQLLPQTNVHGKYFDVIMASSAHHTLD